MTLAGFEDVASAVLAGVAEAAVRGLALAAIAGAALAVLRVRSNSARLWTWTLVLYAAIAMPVLDRVLPRLPLPILGVTESVLSATPPPQPNPQAGPLSVAQPIGTSAPAPDAGAAAGTDGSLSPTARFAAFGIYAAGVLLLLLRAVVGWLMTKRLRRHARPIADTCAGASLARLATARGLSRPPALSEHDQVSVPVAVGVLRPAIVLPVDWPTWPQAKLDAVLAHEIAHVANRDARTLWLSHVYRVFFWWSPLSWWLHARLTGLMELVNDDATLAAGVNPNVYAETLLDFLSRIRHARGRATWQLAMARSRGAVQRVERILAWTDRDRAQAVAKQSVIVGLALLAASVSAIAAAVRPVPIAVTEPPALSARSVPADDVTALPVPETRPTASAEARPAPLPAAHPAPAPQTAATQSPGVTLGIANQPADAPVAIVQSTNTVTEGGFVSVVVRNDSSKLVRSVSFIAVVAAASAVPRTADNSLTTAQLPASIPPGKTAKVEAHVLPLKTLEILAATGGAQADLAVARVEFDDGTVWMRGAEAIRAEITQSPSPAPALAPKNRLQGSYYWQRLDSAPPQLPLVSQDPIVQRQIEAQLQPARLDPARMTFRTNWDNAATIGGVLDGMARSGFLTVRYAPDATNLDKPASVGLRDTTLEAVLHALLDGHGSTFQALGPRSVFIYPDTPANREKYTAVIRTFEIARADVRLLQQQLNRAVTPTEGFRPTILSVPDTRVIVVRAIPELMAQIAKFIADNDR